MKNQPTTGTSEVDPVAECVKEINAVLAKYDLVLDAFVQPGIRLVKAPEKDLDAKIEGNGTQKTSRSK